MDIRDKTDDEPRINQKPEKEFWYFDYMEECGQCEEYQSCKREGYDCPRVWFEKKFLDHCREHVQVDTCRYSKFYLDNDILKEIPDVITEKRRISAWRLTDKFDAQGRQLGVWVD